MKKKKFLFHILIVGLIVLSFTGKTRAQNDAMMQAFYWNVPVDEANKNGTWWDNLASKASELKNAGITGIWIPAPSKGNWGITDMGYGIYDHYDLGNYNQKNTVETRFGSRAELENMIATMHNTAGGAPYLNVYADAVLNHVYSGDENDEANPAVKGYVFDEAFRNSTQYVPYPTNEIKWVIPNAAAGSYYIKIKGYYLDYSLNYTDRGYDCEIDWTGAGFSSAYNWEAEPNNGNGETNDFGISGSTMRGFIGYDGDIDEYEVTLTSTHDIVIKLTARSQGTDGSWNWADQTHGYYPFEIWYNGTNLATSTLEAHTDTHITYVNHTGTDEANYAWTYTDFHPVDANDFLTGWNWNGQDALIPNTKGFGNDFNTYSATVQSRLNAWGYWMANQIGFDGFRLDFVRGYQIDFISSWINNLPLEGGAQRFIVGEYWGVDYQIKNWVEGLAAQGADADAFDFPLKSSLTSMCNGDASFDMRWLNHAGMVRNDQGNTLPGTSVVTWLENHDTGKEHDKWVTKDWEMGYAYILTHEGRPCIFYPHYFGVTLVDNSNSTLTVSIPSSLKDDINKLLFVRKTYLNGGLTVLTETGDPYPAGNAANVYVARRDGNGTKDGAIVVINNNSSTEGVWVTANATGFSNWSNTTLKDAFTGATTDVYADGRVWVEAPARGYAIYVQSNDYEAYTAPLKAATIPQLDKSKVSAEGMVVYPNPVNEMATISFTSGEDGMANIQIFDAGGRVVRSWNQSVSEGRETSIQWSAQREQSGLYFCTISLNGKVTSQKIIVRH
jgi:alpha-amylase